MDEKLKDVDKLRAISEKKIERDAWRSKIEQEKKQGRDWLEEHKITPKRYRRPKP